MVGKAYTYSRMGMTCNIVEVEVDIKKGLPGIYVTGLLSQEVKEVKERIRPAITNSGLDYPLKRITINLSPAETVKKGTHFDLAIAAAILKVTGYITRKKKTAYFGELNLCGEVKWIRGILPMVLSAIEAGFEKIFIPMDNYHEVTFINNDTIIPVNTLTDLIEKIESDDAYAPETHEIMITDEFIGDYSDIMGQESVIDGFKIAAAGHHHMLIVGPPGSGKTMSAGRMPGIMPDLTKDEIIEINKIQSITNTMMKKNWITKRPFRTPHNSSSTRAIIGGGPKVLPGEISLAHKGILFLDEFLEFRTDALQALRTVIEKKEVFISLRNGWAIYPAHFLLVAAANPCPCGYFDTKDGLCNCSMPTVKKYRKKLRNPLIDRIDLQVKVDRINYHNLINGRKNKTTGQLKDEVLRAREVQNKRFTYEKFKLNSEIPAEKISLYCRLHTDTNKYLESIMEENLLTARACHKILRLARTIADLNNHRDIEISDINTAVTYRFLDVDNLY